MMSLWQDVKTEERESLKGNIKADCVVVGGGMAGLMTAFELQKRGFSVVVLEADRICSGATGRTTAKITAQHGDCYHKFIKNFGLSSAKMYFESNTRGIDKYARLIRELDIDCEYKKTPSYIYGRYSEKEIQKETAAADKVGAMYKFTDKTSLPFEVKGALKFENQAQFHPVKFAKALSQNLRIYEKTPAIHIEDGKVVTTQGTVDTHYIVVATHYPIINFPGLYFLRQHQERSCCVAIKTDRTIDGMYLGIDDGKSLRSFHGGVIMGGENYRTGENSKGGCLCRLKDYASEIYTEAEFVSEWTNQDVMTHDGLPFIGRYSFFTPRIFVATGFGKWGMSLSAVASDLIADLICDRKNDYEKLYTPNRVKIKAAFPSFLVDAGYSVKGLAQGFFSKKEKRCTHLGCRLRENREEGTLECPCHGSQFDKKGKVGFSPAKRNIGQK